MNLTPFSLSQMSEADWGACSDPRRMVWYLIGDVHPRVQDVVVFPDCRVSDRKLRLFACDCFWRLRPLFADTIAPEVVTVAERFADGLLPRDDLTRADERILAALGALEGRWRASRGRERASLQRTHDALALAAVCAWDAGPKAAYYASSNASHSFAQLSGRPQEIEQRRQANALRCICGDAVTPAALTPEERHRYVEARKAALAIYEERAFAQLSVVADALEDAGCADASLLGHLRSPGPHARGCWGVDAVLGRT